MGVGQADNASEVRIGVGHEVVQALLESAPPHDRDRQHGITLGQGRAIGSDDVDRRCRRKHREPSLIVRQGVHQVPSQIFDSAQRPKRMGSKQRRRSRVCTEEARRGANDIAIDNGEVQRDVMATESPRP